MAWHWPSMAIASSNRANCHGTVRHPTDNERLSRDFTLKDMGVRHAPTDVGRLMVP